MPLLDHPTARPRILAGLMLATSLVITACAGGSATPTPAASGATQVPTEAASQAPTTPASEAPSQAPTDAPSEEPTSNPDAITIYSGRSESLVAPLLEQIEAATGIPVEVRYGNTNELAVLLLEEGANSPADIFFAQDGGSLGAVANAGLFAELPAETIDKVDARFRSPEGLWVGLSGRARTLAYNPANTDEAELPASVLDLTDASWAGGRIGWVPTNASFQTFVTALRLTEGEDAAKAWLEGVDANEPRVYEGNGAAVQAAAAGEIEVALVNHYYALGLKADDPNFAAVNYFFPGGDLGSLVNVAGAGVLASSDRSDEATAVLDYLLSMEAQTYFAESTFEYPLIEGAPNPEGVPALADLDAPDLDLSQLEDLQGTVALLQETGLLQ